MNKKNPSVTITIKNFNYGASKKAAMVLRAINHKLRQRILQLIEGQKNITVTDIYGNLRLEQSVTSQHLAILRSAEIVTTKRSGKFIFYQINKKRLEEINWSAKELAFGQQTKDIVG